MAECRRFNRGGIIIHLTKINKFFATPCYVSAVMAVKTTVVCFGLDDNIGTEEFAPGYAEEVEAQS